MKLEAVYGPEDFLELVKTDIAAKGYALLGELDKEDFIDLAFSVVVEQKPTPTVVKAEPKAKAPRTVTEKEAARREKIGQRMREANLAKKKPQDEPALGTIDKPIKLEEMAVAAPIERPLPASLPL